MKKFFFILFLVVLIVLFFSPIVIWLLVRLFKYFLILLDGYVQYINYFINDLDISSSIAAFSIVLAFFILIVSTIIYLDITKE